MKNRAMQMLSAEKIKMITAMLIVGTIGIFVHYIPIPSAVISCIRSVIGTLFLIPVILLTKSKLQWKAIKANAVYLTLSGAALGFNWIFLFEAYQYTGVAVATLCYYMAPVFVIILSPLALKEKLTPTKLVCTMGAVLGAVLISGVFGGSGQNALGIGYGLIAAVLYCSIIIINKKISGLSALETTFCQLAVSAVVMVLYVLATIDLRSLVFTPTATTLLLVLGIVHTGIVYMLFFPAIGKLPAQTSAVLSYIDPVTAIILSALVLQQPLGWIQIGGTVLILGCVLLNEMLSKYQQEHQKQTIPGEQKQTEQGI